MSARKRISAEAYFATCMGAVLLAVISAVTIFGPNADGSTGDMVFSGISGLVALILAYVLLFRVRV